MPTERRTFFRLALGAAAALLAGGCASLNQVSSDVASFGPWPAWRAPGRYVFERLPSQQAEVTLQQQLEDAARPALAQAGFTPAPDAARADVTVQLSLRQQRYERLDPWAYPWGPTWGGAYWRGHPGWWGPWGGWWAPVHSQPWYEREVGVIVRDRAGGPVLYEGRARSDGMIGGSPAIYEALFRAALADFPQGNPTPRRVSVPLGAGQKE